MLRTNRSRWSRVGRTTPGDRSRKREAGQVILHCSSSQWPPWREQIVASHVNTEPSHRAPSHSGEGNEDPGVSGTHALITRGQSINTPGAAESQLAKPKVKPVRAAGSKPPRSASVQYKCCTGYYKAKAGKAPGPCGPKWVALSRWDWYFVCILHPADDFCADEQPPSIVGRNKPFHVLPQDFHLVFGVPEAGGGFTVLRVLVGEHCEHGPSV